jgi:acetyl esterase/lipase
MDLERVAPELRSRVRLASVGRIDRAWHRRLVRAVLPVMPSRKVDGVAVEALAGPGRGVRIHRPAEPPPAPAALLWIHGGGLVLGRAAMNDRLCGEIAQAVGITVVAVEYRKAPEHPFPVPLADGHAAWTWLQREATALGIDPARVAVGGESAGGGLAAALAQRLHDEGGVEPVAQLLFCPMLDDRTAARRELDAVGHLVWNNRQNRFGWRSYLGVEPGAPSLPPYAAPARRADLAGLPPAWIGVGDIELFAEEDVAYAERLRACGVPVELRIVPGAPHGFEVWAPDTALAREHVASATGWLRAALRVDAPAGNRP